MAKATEDEIQVRAYDIWVEAGKPHGRHEEFWLQAEKELNQSISSDEEPETFLE
jgi:hypothetical protein